MFGNALDHIHHAGDLLSLSAQLLQGGGAVAQARTELAHALAGARAALVALGGNFTGLTGLHGGLFTTVRHTLRGGGHLRGRRGNLAHLRLLLLDGLQGVLRLVIEHLHRAAQLLALLINPLHGFTQLAHGRVQCAGNTGQIIGALHLQAHTQIPVTQSFSGRNDHRGTTTDGGIQAKQHIQRQHREQAEHRDHLNHRRHGFSPVIPQAGGELLVQRRL